MGIQRVFNSRNPQLRVIACYDHSSFTINNVGTNRKGVCDFLFAIWKKRDFNCPVSFSRPQSTGRRENCRTKLGLKIRIPMLVHGKNS